MLRFEKFNFKKTTRYKKISGLFIIISIILLSFLTSIFIGKFIFTKQVLIFSSTDLNTSINNFDDIFSEEVNKGLATMELLNLPNHFLKYNFFLENRLKSQVAMLDKLPVSSRDNSMPHATLVNENYHNSLLSCVSPEQSIDIAFKHGAAFPNYSFSDFESVIKRFNCKLLFDVESSDKVVLVYYGEIVLKISPSKSLFIWLNIFSFIFYIALIKLIKEIYSILIRGFDYFN